MIAKPFARLRRGEILFATYKAMTLYCSRLNDCYTEGRGFAPAGATKGLSDRPLETFGPVLLMLYFNAVQYKNMVFESE